MKRIERKLVTEKIKMSLWDLLDGETLDSLSIRVSQLNDRYGLASGYESARLNLEIVDVRGEEIVRLRLIATRWETDREYTKRVEKMKKHKAVK